jgi:hypothetical protein
MNDLRQIISDHDRLEELERRMDRLEGRTRDVLPDLSPDHPSREFRPVVPPRVDEVPNA